MTIALYNEIFRRMPLIGFMANRNSRAGVADTALGILWDVLMPASNMFVYYFLIAIVFQRSGNYPAPAYLFIIIGISHYLFFNRVLTGACSVIRNNSSVLMQIPIEPLIFSAVEFRRALGEFAVYVVLGTALYLIAMPSPPVTVVFYPILALFLFFLTWSVGVLLATVCVFMRDIVKFVAIALRLGLYCSAVLYPLSFLPSPYSELLLLNPLATWFGLSHWALYGAPPPPASAIFGMIAFSLAVFFAGHLDSSLKIASTPLL